MPATKVQANITVEDAAAKKALGELAARAKYDRTMSRSKIQHWRTLMVSGWASALARVDVVFLSRLVKFLQQDA